MSVFNKSGRVLAPDSKYTGEEPDWHGWERWPIDKFYTTRQRALGFYNYYLDSATFKPIVLAWMKSSGYCKEDISAIKDAPPWYLPTTVGKLIRMMNQGMPSIHPDAQSYFESSPMYNPDTPKTVETSIAMVRREIKVALDTLRHEKNKMISTADGSQSGQVVPQKKVITPIDRIRARVETDIIPHLDQLIDQWADVKKPVATISLATMLRDQKIPAQGCASISKWVNRHLLEFKGALEKEDQQLVEAYSYLTKANLRKIVGVLESMSNDLVMHTKMKNSMRKPRIKKPKAADKQVARLKYQPNSAEYNIESVSPSRLPGAQRCYLFNTKTRQLFVYIASGSAGFEIKGTSLKGFDLSLSFCATLRKPTEILNGVLAATPKKLDKILDGVKYTPKPTNGRINEYMILLRIVENRI